MGQYYKIVLFEYDDNKKKLVRLALEPYIGSKLMNHSYIGNKTMENIEFLLSPLSPFYKSRIVWAGDYADIEDGSDYNLYQMCDTKLLQMSFSISHTILRNIPKHQYNIIINHTKKQYINKDDYRHKELCIHPLCLLVCDGNGRGGGDYTGINNNLCGSWKNDIISMNDTIPTNYVKYRPIFDAYVE